MKKIKGLITDNIKATILTVIVFGSIFIGVIANDNKPNTSKITITPVIIKATEADKVRLEVLKKRFDYDYDEFQKIGWYTHKDQTAKNSYDRSMLQVNVNSSGYSYLEDQYYGNDWIFHTRIEVLVGEDKYISDDIPTYDKNNHKENGSDSVWESISYTLNRDNGIMTAIAEGSSTPIKVRFTGGDGVKDITLSKIDQQAIKDSYELAGLIKKVSVSN